MSAKGLKARAKLMAAAMVVLEKVGYHKMRIADVTQEAGVASGLFYHYFADLKSLTREVLEDFISRSLQVEDIEQGVARGDWYARILAHNKPVVASYAKRPGIMRCLLQLADEDAEFASLLRNHFIQQLTWLTRRMPKLFPDAALDEHQALMVAYSLAGMAETLLRDYFINREPTLTAKPMSVDEMAELLSVLYYRGLFLSNPPAESLNYTANLTAMHKQ